MLEDGDGFMSHCKLMGEVMGEVMGKVMGEVAWRGRVARSRGEVAKLLDQFAPRA